MTNPSDAGQDRVPIYTIGYGARTVDQLLAVLKTQQIAFVIDVRSAPYSRFKPEFNKNALQREIQTHEIRYTYMGDTLGGRPNDPTCYTDGKVDYDKIKQKDFYQHGIGRLQQAYAQHLRCRTPDYRFGVCFCQKKRGSPALSVTRIGASEL